MRVSGGSKKILRPIFLLLMTSNGMNILVLGSGGREHALAWKMRQSPLVKRVFVSPGNGGTKENVATPDVATFCADEQIALVVIGPDDLLAEGLADTLRAKGIRVFGPSKAAAQIEWSKAYAKELMDAAHIPTAKSRTFTDYDSACAYVSAEPLPIVIKASGLALGKGVVIAKTPEEAQEALAACFLVKKFGEAGSEVVVEEYLEGVEFSVHVLCAGADALLFPASQDHKRVSDNDEGPNTGGMGTVAPFPVSLAVMDDVRERIVLPTLAELAARGRSFSGLLFPGIMLTADGPKVLEFNARFGDPETQSYMRLLKSDIVPALMAAADGDISDVTLEWNEGAAACVVLASGGYPGAYEKGKEIVGVTEAQDNGVVVFHAGTQRVGETLRTSGGRVLGVTAVGASLREALENAYRAVPTIQFSGMHYRRDIGKKALAL